MAFLYEVETDAKIKMFRENGQIMAVFPDSLIENCTEGEIIDFIIFCLTEPLFCGIIHQVMVLSTRDHNGPLAQLVRASGS